MDNWKKVIIILFLSSLLNASLLTVKWACTQNATEYTIHLGRQPGVYYFNYLLDASHYKKNFVYSLLFLEDGETYYISYSFKLLGVERKSGDLKVTMPLVFPKKPTLRVD